MAELHSLSSAVSRDVVALAVQLQAQENSQSDIIKVLAEGLRVAFWGHTAAVATLAKYRASEGDRWKACEKELIDRLGPKATSFF